MLKHPRLERRPKVRDEDRERFREFEAKNAVDWLKIDLPRILSEQVKVLEAIREFVISGNTQSALENLQILIDGTGILILEAQEIGRRAVWE